MNKVFVIAEAGVNHNGDFAMALRLIEAAAHAGADAVKFQTFKSDKLVAARAGKAEYQVANGVTEDSQLAMLRKLEMPEDWHFRLRDQAEALGLVFLSTPFDIESAHFLAQMGMSTFKVPSGEIVNLPLLRAVAKLAKRIILSTGMCDLDEVQAAVSALQKAGMKREQITVLHCTTEYPAPLDEVNLLAMKAMGEVLGVAMGYSDHTEGITVPVAATALGARVIEKHFTLDRGLPGPDHRASLEPKELAAMVTAIRQVERALGDGQKRVTPSELKNRLPVRQSIVAKTRIRYGEVFSENNLTTLRPGDGISPMLWDSLLGQNAKRDFEAHEAIQI